MTLNPARLQWSGDGTLESLDFGDIYFQRGKGLEESDYVFLQQNRLPERFRARTGNFCIGELGFGSGLNFLLTADLFLKTAPENARLFYASAEKHPILKDDLAKIHAGWPKFENISRELLAQYPPMVAGFHSLFLDGGRIQLLLMLGDIADTLPQLSGKFDAWYLDGFSPAKNPAMWQENLFPQIAARTTAGGTLSTFSAAGAVRRGLEAAGFTVEKTKGYGVKRDMTVATLGTPSARKEKIKNIAVLGAGLAGCAAAAALARRGHHVTVFDRQKQAAAETSGNPVGILYPKMTAGPLATALYQHGFCFSKMLIESLRLPSWNPCGVLHLDLSAEGKTRHQTIALQYPTDFIVYQDGLFQPPTGFLSPPEFCEALLKHPDIKTCFSSPLQKIPEGFDALVIALGNDSKIFPETSWLPLQSLRGQISFVSATPASEKIKSVICYDGYIAPAVNGKHCIGATFQKEDYSGFETRAEDHAENIGKINLHLPHLGLSLDHVTGGRVGYRATTPDKLPMIGPLPDYVATLDAFQGLRTGKEVDAPIPYLPNVYLSTGFGAHGLAAAPIAGEIIAALISSEPLPVPQDLLRSLLPERFIFRDLKRKKI